VCKVDMDSASSEVMVRGGAAKLKVRIWGDEGEKSLGLWQHGGGPANGRRAEGGAVRRKDAGQAGRDQRVVFDPHKKSWSLHSQ
jgi:hypothetical protein